MLEIIGIGILILVAAVSIIATAAIKKVRNYQIEKENNSNIY